MTDCSQSRSRNSRLGRPDSTTLQ